MKLSPIFVVSASAARRSVLQEMLRAVLPRTDITLGPELSLDALQRSRAEILLVDLDSRAEAAGMLRFLSREAPTSAAVALIDDPAFAWVRKVLRAGVSAIIPRDVAGEDLRLAIEAADAGLILLHPACTRQVFAPAAGATDPATEYPAVEHLTMREQEVLRLMSDGLGNKEIASRLGISDHTVKFHASSILGKLGAASRTEAVSQGIRRGLIPL